jgi:hypothetical protein
MFSLLHITHITLHNDFFVAQQNYYINHVIPHSVRHPEQSEDLRTLHGATAKDDVRSYLTTHMWSSTRLIDSLLSLKQAILAYPDNNAIPTL